MVKVLHLILPRSPEVIVAPPARPVFTLPECALASLDVGTCEGTSFYRFRTCNFIVPMLRLSIAVVLSQSSRSNFNLGVGGTQADFVILLAT